MRSGLGRDVLDADEGLTGLLEEDLFFKQRSCVLL